MLLIFCDNDWRHAATSEQMVKNCLLNRIRNLNASSLSPSRRCCSRVFTFVPLLEGTGAVRIDVMRVRRRTILRLYTHANNVFFILGIELRFVHWAFIALGPAKEALVRPF